MTPWETNKEHRDSIYLTENYYLLAPPETPGQKTLIRTDSHTTGRNEISIGITVSHQNLRKKSAVDRPQLDPPKAPSESAVDRRHLGLIENESQKAENSPIRASCPVGTDSGPPESPQKSAGDPPQLGLIKHENAKKNRRCGRISRLNGNLAGSKGTL